MKDEKTEDALVVKTRESIFTLDKIIIGLSSRKSTTDLEEAILCLANEIKRIKEHLTINQK